ncbi:MAG: AmmeMemoRadiSam system protein B [Chloroflexi bacterium]|nr:MAG: AmmeMemoRadiSam system protein B [Chloroflexota bacterium]
MSDLPVRRPAVAGQFYPGDPGELRRMIQEFIDQATLPEDLEAVRAIVAPHAGYVYSGPTAGYAFKALAALPEKEWTVFLLGPAHRVYFRGVALGNHAAFRTPLGDAPIAVDRVAEMLERSPLYTRAPEAHAPEHSLEVEVPFLQVVLSEFQLVPMLFGEVDPQEVGAELAAHVGEDDLIVVSNDLSHFYPYDKAQQLDRATLQALISGDEARILQSDACGRAPLTALASIAHRQGWKPHLLDYRTSGDTAGDKWQVVGYAAVAYTD